MLQTHMPAATAATAAAAAAGAGATGIAAAATGKMLQQKRGKHDNRRRHLVEVESVWVHLLYMGQPSSQHSLLTAVPAPHHPRVCIWTGLHMSRVQAVPRNLILKHNHSQPGCVLWHLLAGSVWCKLMTVEVSRDSVTTARKPVRVQAA